MNARSDRSGQLQIDASLPGGIAKNGAKEEQVSVSCSGGTTTITLAQMEYLPSAKRLADQHKSELGFINRAVLQKAIETQSLLLAVSSNEDKHGYEEVETEIVGMLYFYVRRDHTVTLSSIAVAQSQQRSGIGRKLIEKLFEIAHSLGKTQIRLKCPAELPANRFYERLGFTLSFIEPGKHRPLNVWVYTLDSQS